LRLDIAAHPVKHTHDACVVRERPEDRVSLDKSVVAIGGNNRTVFLAGPVMPAGSPTVRVAATISPGTQLIVPIITVECSVAEEPPFHGEDETELRVCANGLLDLASDPQATIDGAPLSDPGAYRPAVRSAPAQELCLFRNEFLQCKPDFLPASRTSWPGVNPPPDSPSGQLS
jgi:hypothetical protein